MLCLVSWSSQLFACKTNTTGGKSTEELGMISRNSELIRMTSELCARASGMSPYTLLQVKLYMTVVNSRTSPWLITSPSPKPRWPQAYCAQIPLPYRGKRSPAFTSCSTEPSPNAHRPTFRFDSTLSQSPLKRLNIVGEIEM